MPSEQPVSITSYPAALMVSVTACLMGAVVFGYHLGVLNTTQTVIASDLNFSLQTMGSFIVSILLLGSAIGALVGGQITSKFGPKTTLMLTALPLIVGALTSASAIGGAVGILAGRLITGLGIGISSVAVPIYLSETSPTPLRGTIGSLNQFMICFGCLLAFVFGIPMESSLTGPAATAWWKGMFAVAVVPSIVQVVLFKLFCPESPVWLLQKGLTDEAKEAADTLWGDAASSEDLEAQGESSPEEVEEGTWSEVLQPKNRLILTLAAAPPILQQFTGINTVIFYAAVVFQKAGLSSPILGTVIIGVVNILATFIATLLSDKAGRRPLMLWSWLIMSTCLGALSLALLVPALEPVSGVLCLGLIVVYVMGFGIGAGPVPWVYLSEVLPARFKGVASSAIIGCHWTANLCVGLSFPLLLNLFGIGGSYGIYAILNFATLAFFYKVLVETKGMSLSELERKLTSDDKTQ